MTIFGRKRSSYKQFKNQNVIGLFNSQPNTVISAPKVTSTKDTQIKNVEVSKNPSVSSIFSRRKNGAKQQQDFIRAINVLYGAERRAQNISVKK